MPTPSGPFPLSERLRVLSAARRAARAPYVIGVGGSVAVGKSTFARALAEAMANWPERRGWRAWRRTGSCFPMPCWAARGLSMRKGFPESYDVGAFHAALAAIRDGARVTVPRYSHVTYDIDPAEAQIVERPDILVLDGLHLAQVERPASRG